MNRHEPENNRLKVPLLLLLVPVGLIAIDLMLSRRHWLVMAVAIAALILDLVALAVVSAGRNPWWTRSPLDPER